MSAMLLYRSEAYSGWQSDLRNNWLVLLSADIAPQADRYRYVYNKPPNP